MRRLLAVAVATAFSGAAHAVERLPGADPFPRELAARIAAALAARDPGASPRTRHVDADGRPRFTNRLILETSPYLRQHAHNPVSWYPWGEEAFRAAREHGRLVFLSVGYSTCHWCHVMEEESFDDLEIAELMNRHYVAIKVDREERPDVDALYMEAVQALAGSGGWPMSVFLTAEGRPFYGGTYFPPRDVPGNPRPGFLTVLRTIQSTYEKERTEIVTFSERLASVLQEGLAPPGAVGMPGAEEILAAFESYRSSFDRENGGLRSRTKFPSSLPISLLLRVHRRTGDPEALEMAKRTLDAMQRGGIYDHVAGGFHRYTIEPTWTVPHFEKMLYDNAQLALAYTEAYQATGEMRYAEVARDVLEYLVRERRSPLGTFFAASDADSEGAEGTYFLWTPAQVRAAVGAELAPLALAAYGVSERGNFEGGRTVLRRDASLDGLAERFGIDEEEAGRRIRESRIRLRAAREKREPPHTDRKEIVAWNGLAISAFARAGLVLGDPGFVEAAGRAARAILQRGRPEGRLARYLAEGVPRGSGLLEDHAFLIAGLLDLHEASGEPAWLDAAIELQTDLDRRFFDESRGGYFISPVDGERLLVREKPGADGALPSGNSVELLNLLRLHLLTGDEEHRMRAEMTVRAFSDLLAESAAAFGRMLEGVDFLLDRPKEILVVTPSSREQASPFLRDLARVFLPNRVLVVASEPELGALASRIPLLEGKRALAGRATAYVCENRVCDLPARDVATFAKQIRKGAAPYSFARDGGAPRPEKAGIMRPHGAEAKP